MSRLAQKIFLVFPLLFILSAVGGGAHAKELAVVVHKDNETDEVSLEQLRRIFTLEQKFWKKGERIYLLLWESGGPQKQIVLEKVYRMSEPDLKRFWINQMFLGEASSFPKTLNSDEAVKRFVRSVPNAVGFIDAGAGDDTVKVLKIDGKTAGDPLYPLKDGQEE